MCYVIYYMFRCSARSILELFCFRPITEGGSMYIKWMHIKNYFSWFYANKGVIVGRRISQFLEPDMIPPAFIAVIERAKVLSLGLR